MRYRHLLLACLVVGLSSLPLASPLTGQPPLSVERGQIEREGRTWVEHVGCFAPVAEGGRLVLRTDIGSVVVSVGQNDRMECTVRLRAYASDEEEARRQLGRFEVGLRSLEGGGVSLRGRVTDSTPDSKDKYGRWKRRDSLRLKVDYIVRVPLRFNLDVETSGGEIEVEQLQGELQAVTAGGSIRSGDISGAVRVETAGGGIYLGNLGQRAEVRTAGGGIRVGDVQGDAVLETSGGEIVAGKIAGTGQVTTAGGDVVVRASGGDLIAETAGGQIHVGEAGGSVRAETAGGSIQLDATRGPVQAETAGGCIYLDRIATGVRAATVAGKISARFTANRASFVASMLESAFGDVEVYLPADLPLTIDAVIENASGHTITSDFPLQVQGDQQGFQFQPRTVAARGLLNGGGELLRIRTTAGSIEIRRLDMAEMQQLQQKNESLWKRLFEREKRREEKREMRTPKPPTPPSPPTEEE
ncbi:MAG: DUF4097 family beta strand repeat-containing protein [Candidatus Acidiferrales bacterium]